MCFINYSCTIVQVTSSYVILTKLLCVSSLIGCTEGIGYRVILMTFAWLHKNIGNKRWSFETTRN